MDSQRFNLTRGEIPQKLLMVALPIIGTQLMIMSYNLVDMFLLGRVSSKAVAASGAGGMFLWLAGGVMLIGRMGAEIGVAQSKGRRDNDLAVRYASNAILLATILGLLFATVCLVAPGPLVRFLAIREADVAADATDYLFIIALGLPFNFIASAISGVFTGAGNSRSPFVVNACGLVLNAVLDPLFIFTLGMGVRGAAIATSISQFFAFALSLYWLLRHDARPFREFPLWIRPDRQRIRQIFRWTVPVSLESLLFTFFAMVVTRTIAGHGADALTVYRVVSQIESLCWIVCLGFASGITTFMGQNYGAGQWSRIWKGFRLCLGVGMAWGVFTTLLFFFLGARITALIVPDPHIAAMGATALRIIAVSEIFFCLESVAGGTFRGLGRTAPPSIAGIVSNGLRVPVVHFLSQSSLGLDGVWIGISLTASLRGLWIFLWFLRYGRGKPKTDTYVAGDSARFVSGRY